MHNKQDGARNPGRHGGRDGLTSPHISRRRLLAGGAAATAVWGCRPWAMLQAQEQAEKTRGRLKIVDIEAHAITVPYEDWIA